MPAVLQPAAANSAVYLLGTTFCRTGDRVCGSATCFTVQTTNMAAAATMQVHAEQLAPIHGQ